MHDLNLFMKNGPTKVISLILSFQSHSPLIMIILISYMHCIPKIFYPILPIYNYVNGI